MVEPHDFQADGPGIVGSDICTVCGKEREDHEPCEWLIRKDGYYYRPNCRGYTTSKFEAGRYTKSMAEAEAAVEPWHMKAIHQDDVEDDPVSSRVRMDAARIAELEAENARLTKERDEWEIWARQHHSDLRRAEAIPRTGAVKELIEKAFSDPVEFRPTGWREQQPALRSPSATEAKARILSALTTEPAAPRCSQCEFGVGGHEPGCAAAPMALPSNWADARNGGNHIPHTAEPAAQASPFDSDEPQQEADHNLAALPLDREQQGNGVATAQGEPVGQEIVETVEHGASVAQAGLAVPGNGEIVTDWERYRHPHDGDVGDEAVAECPDCNGEGTIADHGALEGQQEAMEALAEFLCSEFDFDLDPVVGASWPEHKDDDGYRGAKHYVRLQPSDVQARARENASRILAFIGQFYTRPAEQAVTEALPQDVIDLIIAARIVAFDDQSPEALRCLDVAVGAFAERVPWDDDPEALKAASEASG